MWWNRRELGIRIGAIAVQKLFSLMRSHGFIFALISFFSFFFFPSFFAISWAAPVAYGGSQARGPIAPAATGLRQGHSNAGSEPRLQPTPQLTATPDR